MSARKAVGAKGGGAADSYYVRLLRQLFLDQAGQEVQLPILLLYRRLADLGVAASDLGSFPDQVQDQGLQSIGFRLFLQLCGFVDKVQSDESTVHVDREQKKLGAQRKAQRSTQKKQSKRGFNVHDRLRMLRAARRNKQQRVSHSAEHAALVRQINRKRDMANKSEALNQKLAARLEDMESELQHGISDTALWSPHADADGSNIESNVRDPPRRCSSGSPGLLHALSRRSSNATPNANNMSATDNQSVPTTEILSTLCRNVTALEARRAKGHRDVEQLAKTVALLEIEIDSSQGRMEELQHEITNARVIRRNLQDEVIDLQSSKSAALMVRTFDCMATCMYVCRSNLFADWVFSSYFVFVVIERRQRSR